MSMGLDEPTLNKIIISMYSAIHWEPGLATYYWTSKTAGVGVTKTISSIPLFS